MDRCEYQIEQNEPVLSWYVYLTENGSVSEEPSEALRFDSFEEAEKVMIERGIEKGFHVQKMIHRVIVERISR